MSEILKEKNILIMDDEENVRDLVVEMFHRHDAKTYPVSTAHDALQMVEEQNYDLIILDRNLPESSGNEVLKQLKSSDNTKNTPVIMLTGDSAMEDIQESISLGAVGYIVKPFSPKDFITQVEKILSKAA